MTADPYQASAGAGDPGSWNRYAYVQGDPVNYTDPSGLLAQMDPWATDWLDALYFDAIGGPDYAQGASQTLLQRIQIAFEPLLGSLGHDWEYGNAQGTSVIWNFSSANGQKQSFRFGLRQIEEFAHFAKTVWDEAKKKGATKENCERLKDGIEVNKDLQTGTEVVGAGAAAVALYSGNPYAAAVATVAAVGHGATNVSERVLQKIYDDFDCDKVLAKK